MHIIKIIYACGSGYCHYGLLCDFSPLVAFSRFTWPYIVKCDIYIYCVMMFQDDLLRHGTKLVNLCNYTRF